LLKKLQKNIVTSALTANNRL